MLSPKKSSAARRVEAATLTDPCNSRNTTLLIMYPSLKWLHVNNLHFSPGRSCFNHRAFMQTPPRAAPG